MLTEVRDYEEKENGDLKGFLALITAKYKQNNRTQIFNEST